MVTGYPLRGAKAKGRKPEPLRERRLEWTVDAVWPFRTMPCGDTAVVPIALGGTWDRDGGEAFAVLLGFGVNVSWWYDWHAVD